ncbi:hypothetical protein TanjilG_00135 [Lupinus angustifolius]|uniref:Auxin-induced protein n=2 Tax=Lupinus angustifolius TaxID=3871 RepID=A0A394D059_LUPAN|nr:hypothetical protein TanjilG_00135 [Lupinus angustifolius]
MDGRSRNEEKKLELRLGPPSEYWSLNEHQDEDKVSSFLQNSTIPKKILVKGKDDSQLCCSKVVEFQNGDKKGFSPSYGNTSMPNRFQKRSAPGPVVGWPPIRSIRKNIASGSYEKQYQHNAKKVSSKIDNTYKGLFVKINMDGVPIGRKVDINAYGSYEKLSSAVDNLFRDLLLATQRDSCAIRTQNKEEKVIMGVLDGSREYTLVYEDNEGDKLLLGDVPWHLFVSTVKRLRVVKSSDLSGFVCKQDNIHNLTQQ